jgi:tetratricopeptide (TPR) repeat protein
VKSGYHVLLPLMMLLLLAACRSDSGVYVYHSNPEVEAPEPEPEQPVLIDEEQLQKQRILADILYDAKAAFAAGRLMVPAGRSAYELYQQVLRLDPENAVALEGVQEIALRYISMADAAIKAASYDNAEQYIARAMRLNPERPELAEVKAQLAAARKNRTNIHELNPAALSSKSLPLMHELGEIARQIQASGGTFLIRARTDEEGRWIYKTMREAVGGYRLRGNIETGATPGIVISAGSGDSKPAGKAPRD